MCGDGDSNKLAQWSQACIGTGRLAIEVVEDPETKMPKIRERRNPALGFSPVAQICLWERKQASLEF